DRAARRDRRDERPRRGRTPGTPDEILALAQHAGRSRYRHRAPFPSRGEGEHALDVQPRRASPCAAFQPGPHDPARERGGLGGDAHGEAVVADETGRSGGRGRSEEVLLVAQARGQARERAPEAGVELRGEEREHEATDAVAGKGEV